MSKSNFFFSTICFLLLSSISTAQNISQPISIDKSTVAKCQSENSDSDGDGWGWENMKSCRVGDSFNQEDHPVCSSANSDPDGDGWGWENNESCKVDTNPTASNNTCIDTDGDGWGWDGKESCVADSNNSEEQNINQNSISITPKPGSKLSANKINLKIDFGGKKARSVKLKFGKKQTFSSALKTDLSNGSYLNTNQIKIDNPSKTFSQTVKNLPIDNSLIEVTAIIFYGTSAPDVLNFTYHAADTNGSTDSNSSSDNTNNLHDEPDTQHANSNNSNSEPGTTPTTNTVQSAGCYNPWASGGMNLKNRVRRLMENPYRTGFGGNATGGTKRLVVVSNPAATGSGSFADVISKASPGDFIVFDPKHDTYRNGCDRGGCKVPGDVTIDGSLSNGKFVELVNNQSDTYYSSLIFKNGNNILTNIKIEHNTLAGAVGISNGENYWLDAFEIRAYEDDALGIGDATGDPNNSADLITVSRYRVHGGPKGILMNVGGQSCQDYPLKDFKSDTDWGGGVPTDVAINQRRARVTIINSDLAAGTRNILNKGGYADIIGSYIHGRVENNITWGGGQTLIRCSYIDSRTVRTRGIRVEEGFFAVGKNKGAPRFCPQQSEAFLDGNIYRQVKFPAESTNPRINVSGSDIDTGGKAYLTDGIENWSNPAGGRSAFSRHYENDIQQFCTKPAPSSVAGPEFVVEQHCN